MDTNTAELQQAWATSPLPSLKIDTYFPIYAELFGGLRGTSCVFVETGVLAGGSLFMWRKWLGPNARIIGIDLNPAAKRWEQHGFEIFIGDQADPTFWEKTCTQIGEFDVFLDDGGHQSFQQIVTLNSILQHSRSKCLVVIEDTLTSYMVDYGAHGRHSFMSYAKECAGFLTARGSTIFPDRTPKVINKEVLNLLSTVRSVEFFDSIVAFKIDPELKGKQSARIVNNNGDFPKDFRYAGLQSAEVTWPDPYREERVIVKGGRA